MKKGMMKKGMGGGYEFAKGGDMRVKEMGKKAPKKMMAMKKASKKNAYK